MQNLEFPFSDNTCQSNLLILKRKVQPMHVGLKQKPGAIILPVL